jgi:FkbM family methyltransferase
LAGGEHSTLRFERLEAKLDVMSSTLSRLEKIAHGGKAVYVGSHRMLVKVTIGDVNLGYLVESDDLLLAPYLMVNGFHERDITNFFHNAIGEKDNCIDVGANFGYYTCMFGKLARNGKTIALEPDEKMFTLLRDNIYINSLEATTIPMHLAAADSEATLTLHQRTTRSGNTSFVQVPAEILKQMGEPPSAAFDVAAVPIDKLLPEVNGRVDHIKIDVEGAERLVLRGAQQTIANNPHISIVMEWSPNQLRAAGVDPAQFTVELSQMGLCGAAITAGRPEPISWDALLGLTYHAGILLTPARQ